MSSTVNPLIMIALADALRSGRIPFDSYTANVVINGNSCTVTNTRVYAESNYDPSKSYTNETPVTRVVASVTTSCPAVDDPASIKVTGDSYITINTATLGGHKIPISSSVLGSRDQLYYAGNLYLSSGANIPLPPVASEHYDTSPLLMYANVKGMEATPNWFWSYYYSWTFVRDGTYNPFYKVFVEGRVISDMQFGLLVVVKWQSGGVINIGGFTSVTSMNTSTINISRGTYTLFLRFNNPLIYRSFENACLAGVAVGKFVNNDPSQGFEYYLFGMGNTSEDCANPTSVTFTSSDKYFDILITPSKYMLVVRS
mgnify:CR=1 FL=1